MPAVDPRFPTRLRQLRTAAGLSLRQLAEAAHVGKSTLSELENAITRPSPEMAVHLDRVLDASGRLATLVPASGGPDPDDRVRIRSALAAPTRVDSTAVAALADILAAHRRADDVMPAGMLLPAVEAELVAVVDLARDARGPAAPAARWVAAEWLQFTGWLLAESRHDARAVRMLQAAAEAADELGDGPLAAQAADFRGYIARHRGAHRAAARWCLAAADTPGATRLQRAINLVHGAGSLAICGQRQDAGRLLATAEELVEAGEPAPPHAYWLSPAFLRLPLGVALLSLGYAVRAAEHLTAGLAGLPAGWAEAEWAGEYRRALERASG